MKSVLVECELVSVKFIIGTVIGFKSVKDTYVVRTYMLELATAYVTGLCGCGEPCGAVGSLRVIIMI